MSVVATPAGVSLVMVYQVGADSHGAPITRQRTLNSIVYTASEQAVFEAAQALFSLSKCPLINVYMRETKELIDQE